MTTINQVLRHLFQESLDKTVLDHLKARFANSTLTLTSNLTNVTTTDVLAGHAELYADWGRGACALDDYKWKIVVTTEKAGNATQGERITTAIITALTDALTPQERKLLIKVFDLIQPVAHNKSCKWAQKWSDAFGNGWTTGEQLLRGFRTDYTTIIQAIKPGAGAVSPSTAGTINSYQTVLKKFAPRIA